MTKKNFSGGLNSLLGEKPTNKKELNLENAKGFLEELSKEISKDAKAKKGRPITQTKEINKSSEIGTKDKETRATFIINEELVDKLKAVAYWERKLIKDIVSTGLEEYLNKIKVKPRPEEVRIKDQEATQNMIRKKGFKARLPKY